MGVPLTLIGEAVLARALLAIKEDRVEASKLLTGPGPDGAATQAHLVDDLERALYASKIIS